MTPSSSSFRSFLTRLLLLAAAVVGTLAPAGLLVAPAQAAKSRQLGSRTLKTGDTGKDVTLLQKLLGKAGMTVDADGQYGPGTSAAVRRFQAAAHIKPTGKADALTVQALVTAVAGSAGDTYQAAGGISADATPGNGDGSNHSLGDRIPVKEGMSGHDVKILQAFLKQAGMKGVTVDGEFGANTLRAEKAFEAKEKLPVDGVVDANDIDVLRGLAGAGGSDATAGAAPLPLAPGQKAVLTPDGLAQAPASAPPQVQAIINAGNEIAKTPYIYGGGHGKWQDKGYDCSGSVSYALHGAGLLDSPLVSGDFPSWGDPGPGQWVTIYGNSGHVWMVVAGLRFDTSGAKQDGSRWHKDMRPTTGYGVSHPPGL